MRRFTKAQPIGGAFACSCASSIAYSGGTASGMVAISCATFMIGPLSPPSMRRARPPARRDRPRVRARASRSSWRPFRRRRCRPAHSGRAARKACSPRRPGRMPSRRTWGSSRRARQPGPLQIVSVPALCRRNVQPSRERRVDDHARRPSSRRRPAALDGRSADCRASRRVLTLMVTVVIIAGALFRARHLRAAGARHAAQLRSGAAGALAPASAPATPAVGAGRR